MEIKEAIQKAIEGGWGGLKDKKDIEIREIEVDNDKRVFINFLDNTGNYSDHFPYYLAEILLDPQFWKCLGKALGWDEYTAVEHGNWDDMRTMTKEIVLTWRIKWHKLIDFLAEGNTIAEYFKGIKK
jgi:hypothetical protein